MTARLPIALLALTLAFGCSKKKPQTDPEEAKQKLLPYILSAVPEIPNGQEDHEATDQPARVAHSATASIDAE